MPYLPARALTEMKARDEGPAAYAHGIYLRMLHVVVES
jgi:hypothetical protein